MATHKLSMDGRVKFLPKKHVYKLGKKQLTSVTTLLSEFFGEFDVKKISKFKAMISKRQGKPHENATFWKKKWKENGVHGSRVHAYMEEFVGNPLSWYFKLDGQEVDKVKVLPAVQYLKKTFSELGHNIQPFSEVILYDESNWLAGQADLVVFRKEGKKTVVDIFDYKTNEKITMEGYNKQMAKAPIQDMPDSSFSKYTLQMSFYAYMLEKQGYLIGNLTLLHLKPGECVPMSVKYEKERVLKILEHKAQTNI